MSTHRRLLLFLFTLIFISCDKDEFIDMFVDNNETIEFSNNLGVKIEKYMSQSSGSAYVQGAAAYDKFLFQFEDLNKSVFVYNLAQKKFIKQIELIPNSSNHCNQASFSKLFYDNGDSFPLLYVSGGKGSFFNRVQVYRITGENESIEIKQIQEIFLPEKNETNWVSWTCSILDNDNQYLYAYASNASTRLIKFEIPDYHQEIIHLTDSDIIEFIPLDHIDHQQGGIIRDGLFYMIFGVPQWGDQVWLRIFNLVTKTEIARYNLSENNFKGEPESIFFYNNELYAATKNAGIFKIKFTKP